jgi:uncharacterized protein (TIGR00288 family)
MSDRTWNVAIYWDFENIQASLVEKKGGMGGYGRTKFQAQEALIDVDSVMEYAATFGVISINRAYCNWQWYGKYREALLRNGLELIQLFPPGASAKNGGDIKLALDCTEDLLRFPHLDIVVIVGGDSDYLPLAQKVKAMGKNLVGIGTQANTNRHWARSCHEFKFYEALILDDEPTGEVQPTVAPVVVAASAEAQAQPAAVTEIPVAVVSNAEVRSDRVIQAAPEELLRRAIRRLSGKTGDAWVLKGSIRPMLKRLDPTFEEEQHGARSFSSFIRRFEHILEVRAGRNDQEIRLRGPDEILPEKTPEQRERERGERHREERGERNERNREGERFERGERERGERHERNRDRDRDRDSRRRNERFGPERPLDQLVRPVREGFNSPEPDPVEPPPSAPVAEFLTETVVAAESVSSEVPAAATQPKDQSPAKAKSSGRNRSPRAKAPAKEKPAAPKPSQAKPKTEAAEKPAAKPRRPSKPKKEG